MLDEVIQDSQNDDDEAIIDDVDGGGQINRISH